MNRIPTPKRIEGHLTIEADEPFTVVDRDGIVYNLTEREETELAGIGYDFDSTVTFEPFMSGNKRYARNVLYRT